MQLDRSACVVVGTDEPFGVRRAAASVAADISAVLGAPVRCVARPTADARALVIVESNQSHAKRIGFDTMLDTSERFVLRQVEIESRPTLVISGSDERGAIYGLYHFSHVHLGVDPLHHFTGNRPARRDAIEVKNVHHISVPAAFTYRGWHVENVQTLKQWRDAKGRDRYWPYWEHILETLLRLGGNMVKPNTNDPDSPEVALAQRMGLLITQEHCCPLGVGMWNIHSDDPEFKYNFDDHPEVFIRHWAEAIDKYPDPKKVIWTLGFRGKGDRPFWMDEPERYPTDAARGELISRVLRIQQELVQSRVPDAQFIHNTWMEGNRLVSHGHTRPPAGTHVVYADNGYGTFRSMIAEGCDHDQVASILPAEQSDGTGGVYYHVSMWDFNTPFLCNFVPPQRMETQFAEARAKQLNGYLLVNVGRVRDCISGIAAIAHIWRYGQFSAEDFHDQWCARFGSAAKEAGQCYDALHETPFKWGEWGKWDDYMVADVGYIRRGATFIEEAINPTRRRVYESLAMKFWEGKAKTLPEQLTYMRKQAAGVAHRWDNAYDIASAAATKLSGAQLAFFTTDIASGIEIHRMLNRYLLHVIEAVAAYLDGQFSDTLSQISQADRCIDEVEATLRRREYEPWSGWNTPALLRFACLPMARHWNQLLVHVTESMTTNRPTAW